MKRIFGIAMWNLLRDHVRHEHRVLDRVADRRAEPPVVDHRRAHPCHGRMHEQDGAAAVHLGVKRLELGFRHRAAEAGDVHVHADAAQFVQPARHLAQRCVDVRQGQRDVGGDAVRVARRQLGVAVVQQVDRRDALGFVRQVGLAVRREDLPLNPGGVHQREAALDVVGRIGHRVAGDALLVRHADPRRKAVAHERAEFLRNVMRVDVADHGIPPVLARAGHCCRRASVAVSRQDGHPRTRRAAQELR